MQSLKTLSDTHRGLTRSERRKLIAIPIAVVSVTATGIGLLASFGWFEMWIPTESRGAWTVALIAAVAVVGLIGAYVYVTNILASRFRTHEQRLKRMISVQTRASAYEAILTTLESCRDGVEVDAMGTGLSEFWEKAHKSLEKLPDRSRVRILLLDPSFPDPRDGRNMAWLQEQVLGATERQVRRDVLRWYNWLMNNENLRAKIEIRLHRTIPAFEMIRVDKSLTFSPSAIHSRPRDIPTFYIRNLNESEEDAHEFFKALRDQFSSVWESPNTRCARHVPAWEFDAWRYEMLVPLSGKVET